MPPKIIDDDEEIIKKPTKKKLVVDDDEEEEVIKKPTKKKIADDDEDEVVKKPAKKKPAIADDDDDEAAVKKPKKKVVVDDDEAAAPKKAAHVDPEAGSEEPKVRKSKFGADITVRSAKGVDAAATGTSSEGWVPPEYDAMDLAAFIEHLKSKTKLKTMEEVGRRNEKARQAALVEQKEKIEPFPDGTGGHSYEKMLNTFIESTGVVDKSGQELDIPDPELGKEGSKKVIIANYMKICQSMDRDPELLRKYLDIKLSMRAPSSVNGKQELVVNISKLPKSVLLDKLKNFVADYVKCAQCGCFNTQLSPTLTLTCDKCGAQRQVLQEKSLHMSDTSKRKKRR